MSGKGSLKMKLRNVNVINMIVHLKMVKVVYFMFCVFYQN